MIIHIKHVTPAYIIIRDIDINYRLAERLVRELLFHYGKKRRIYYYDSFGDLNELVHDGEKFVDFRSGGPEKS